MIPAKIIKISDKVVVEYERTIIFSWLAKDRIKKKYIAEVENVEFVNDILNIMLNYFIIKFSNGNYFEPLKLNQQVFIEPTENGKCVIIKI